MDGNEVTVYDIELLSKFSGNGTEKHEEEVLAFVMKLFACVD